MERLTPLEVYLNRPYTPCGVYLMATMKDVASLAGVSITTVSHVINKTRAVSEESRARVREAVDRLGYRPHDLARSLRSGKTRTLGIVIPDSSNPYFAELTHGIQDIGYLQDYSVILCNTENDPHKEAEYLWLLDDKNVDGIALMTNGDPKEVEPVLGDIERPLVLLDRDLGHGRYDTVTVDNLFGAALAVNHLVELGHTEIACISGPESTFTGEQRLEGFRRALLSKGLQSKPGTVVEGNFSADSGYAAAKRIFESDADVSAIFAANDLMALGARQALFDLAIEVPGDVSIIGFDDIYIASLSTPRLTTIAQPIFGLGETACKMLLERIRDPGRKPRSIILPTVLVKRASTSWPRNRRLARKHAESR